MSCTNDPRLEVWPSHKFSVLKGHCGRPAISLTHSQKDAYIQTQPRTGMHTQWGFQQAVATYNLSPVSDSHICAESGRRWLLQGVLPHARARSLATPPPTPKPKAKPKPRQRHDQPAESVASSPHSPPPIAVWHVLPNMPPACVGSHDPPNPLPEWAVM